MYRRKIIIDTDPGHDDALAMMLLVRSGLFDIKAVTTVAGNTDIQKTTNNARFLLDLLEEDAPIFSGAKKPIKRELIKANVHGKSGLDGVNVIKKEKLNGLAVDKIVGHFIGMQGRDFYVISQYIVVFDLKGRDIVVLAVLILKLDNKRTPLISKG